MRLLSRSSFDQVFSPLAEKRIGVVDGIGNVGDWLIYRSTRQLLDEYAVLWQTINPITDAPTRDCYDVVLLFGGGWLGIPGPNQAIRRAAVKTGIPCTVLPKSCLIPEAEPFAKIFVREAESMSRQPRALLAPDLALGYEFPEPAEPMFETGVFLKKGGGSIFGEYERIDPTEFCDTPAEYIAFASRYTHIVTDRLHLAITALGLNRRVTLLPVAQHKNRSMWETWLRDLGCEWAARPEDAL